MNDSSTIRVLSEENSNSRRKRRQLLEKCADRAGNRAVERLDYIFPDSSMLPTIRIGEKFKVDFDFYKNSKPKRGDLIAVCRDDLSHGVWVVRVIGLPSERVEVKEESFFITGRKIKTKKLDEKSCRSLLAGASRTSSSYNVICYQEDLDGVVHYVLRNRNPSIFDDPPLELPKNVLYVEVDNRTYSSRLWESNKVRTDQVVGKVLLQSKN